MQDYDKAQVIIHKNMEHEKEQIHEQFKSINVPVYLHLRLCETVVGLCVRDLVRIFIDHDKQ